MIAALVTWLSREVHRYVTDVNIGHVSGWQPMTRSPPVYRAELLASMFTATLLKEPWSRECARPRLRKTGRL